MSQPTPLYNMYHALLSLPCQTPLDGGGSHQLWEIESRKERQLRSRRRRRRRRRRSRRRSKRRRRRSRGNRRRLLQLETKRDERGLPTNGRNFKDWKSITKMANLLQ